MSNHSQAQNKALAAKLQRMSKRIDVKVVDGVFDEILKQIATLKSVSCTLADDSSLCLQTEDGVIATVKVYRAKSVLRVMCARLALRSSEWAGGEVSLYGGHFEFELPKSKLLCKVDFKNTPDAQRFEISHDAVTFPNGASTDTPKTKSHRLLRSSDEAEIRK